MAHTVLVINIYNQVHSHGGGGDAPQIFFSFFKIASSIRKKRYSKDVYMDNTPINHQNYCPVFISLIA